MDDCIHTRIAHCACWRPEWAGAVARHGRLTCRVARSSAVGDGACVEQEAEIVFKCRREQVGAGEVSAQASFLKVRVSFAVPRYDQDLLLDAHDASGSGPLNVRLLRTSKQYICKYFLRRV